MYKVSLGRQEWFLKKRCLTAQSIMVALSVLRLVTKDDDGLAGLALISSLRKRLCNLPGNLATDKAWRVRLRRFRFCSAEQAAVVSLSMLYVVSRASTCSTWACCMRTSQGQGLLPVSRIKLTWEGRSTKG